MAGKIKKLSIRNFQKWERLEIDLDPHVTVLVGPSDVGKSAVLRALKWLALNRPNGRAFIRRGSDWARVSLDVGGITVGRKKGKGKNAYSVGGKDFVAAGSKVPEEVARLLNLDETNFQGQHDSPLWFMRSPGEVSRELNRIVDLEAIDKALGRAAAELRRAKALAEVSKARLGEARGRRKVLDWVPQADRELAGVEELGKGILEDGEKAAGLAELLEAGRGYQEAIQDAGNEALGLANAVSLGNRAVELADRATDLRELLDKVIRQRDEAERLAGVRRAVAAELKKVRTCPACGKPIRS